MPRSQPSLVERLTGEFLKLTSAEQTVVLGVFGAIVKSGARTAPVRRPVARVAIPEVVTPVAAPAPVRKRKPPRKVEPVALAEPQYAEPAETEQV